MGVTPLHHYYGSSDSCRSLPPRQVSPLNALELPPVPSPTTLRPSVAALGYPEPDGSPSWRGPTSFGALGEFGFAFESQARRVRPAESSSSSYGPGFHLLLLPTPPRGDAVAVGYGPESHCPTGTFIPLIQGAHGRTIPAFAGMTKNLLLG